MRPHYPRHNPYNKRWMAFLQARYWRDNRIQRIRNLLTRWDSRLWGRPIEQRLARELRRYQDLQNNGQVDEYCFPEWAAKRWRVNGAVGDKAWT